MTVYLVGAGPGDPGLLTIRGREVLAEANVVLYDALIDPRILGLAPPGATLIDAGKAERGLLEAEGEPRRARRHAMAQPEINELLVRYGRSGACVVRLKGGDPFVFGRGSEEALALAEAGIPFEVVPGVSSAIAAPAYAGIPVTHRGLAASMAIVTAHEAPGKGAGAARVDWSRLATAVDTLVILMGVARLPQLAAALMAAGRPPATPAAVIERGTTPYQRTVTGTLETIASRAAEAGIASPAAIVVGDVVSLHEHLAWFAPPRAECPSAAAEREVGWRSAATAERGARRMSPVAPEQEVGSCA